jgi:hypothetical protein
MGEGEIDFVFGFAVEFEEDSFLFEMEDVIIDLLVNELFKIHLQLYYTNKVDIFYLFWDSNNWISVLLMSSLREMCLLYSLFLI